MAKMGERSTSFNGRAVAIRAPIQRQRTDSELTWRENLSGVSTEIPRPRAPTKLLLNVTLERSVGAVHVVMSPEQKVSDLVAVVVRQYVKEGRLPKLATTDPSRFNLHFSQFSLERSRQIEIMEQLEVTSNNELLDLCGFHSLNGRIDSEVGENDNGENVSGADGNDQSGNQRQLDNSTVVPTVVNGDDKGEPFENMRFESLADARVFYQEYGANHGFNTKIRSSETRGKGAEARETVKFACSCEGKYLGKKPVSDDTKRRRTSHDRKLCPARMIVKESKDKTHWYVSKFVKKHTHSLLTPSKKVLLRSQRGMTPAQKKLLESFDAEGIPLNRVVRLFGETTQLGFDQRDCYNYIRKAREYNEGGDAQSVRDYLKNMVYKDPQSYHAIQQDDDGRAINFFWVDGRSRNAYALFGDVVSFDTTYRTNKYSMPFAPFTGVNHHGQSILFGCALLENETEETFVWAFENWLQAMGRKAPTSIITDQDRAMGRAIARVMRDTRHRYCIWHIKKKFAEKLGSIFFKNPSFKTKLDECIHKTYTIGEFEAKWSYLIDAFELKDHEWLIELYQIRERWVPVYNQTTFFAGMMTSQRSESINQFFNGFVTPSTTLFEFVKKLS